MSKFVTLTTNQTKIAPSYISNTSFNYNQPLHYPNPTQSIIVHKTDVHSPLLKTIQNNQPPQKRKTENPPQTHRKQQIEVGRQQQLNIPVFYTISTFDGKGRNKS